MNEDSFDTTYYWSVDLPGLTKADADRIVEWADRNATAIGAHAVDPVRALTSHMDADSVRALRSALRIALDSGSLSEREGIIARGVWELADEWLTLRPAD